MVTAARVPADGTRSNSGRQLAMPATTGNGKGSKRTAKVTPNCSWQSPVSSDSSRFKLYGASGPSSPPPWSGRVVTGREFARPNRNRGVTSSPCRCQPSDAAASRGYPVTTVGRQGGSRKWRNWAEKGISRDDAARRHIASLQQALPDTTGNRQGGDRKWRIWVKNGKSVTAVSWHRRRPASVEDIATTVFRQGGWQAEPRAHLGT